MILMIIAGILFVCFGTTGKLVRHFLTQFAAFLVYYLGIPLFGAAMLWFAVTK